MRSLEQILAGIVIGSQVAAPWQDGIFYPGIVKFVTSRPMGDTLYTVEFDDRYVKDFTQRQIIVNSHFQNTKDVHLKFNQRVFVTHCEMEMCGFVQKHRKQTNEVFIKLDDSEETLVRKKLEEVRLLSHHNNVNVFGFTSFDEDTYTLNSPSASMESKKRTVADGIEVPCAKTQKVTREEEPAMNEVMAAMILTSLQTASPSFAQCQPMDCTGPPSPSGSASCSSDSPWSPNCNSSPSPSASSGHFSWDIQSRGSPSPGLSISDAESLNGPVPSVFHYMPHGTPLESMPGALMFSSSLDEGIDMGENGSSVYWDEQNKSPKKIKTSSKTLYKCTWQRCTKTLCTIQGIERHIRTVHLRKQENDFSDHEEEFYYTEVESTMEAFSDMFASMMASSPPPVQHDSNGNVVSMTTYTTHDHQATENNRLSQAFFPTNMVTQQLNCNSNQSLHYSPNSTSIFKAIPSTTNVQKHNKKFHTEDHPRSPYVQPPKQHQAACSPTKVQLQLAGLTCNTKIHAEGRKCRKVYGMENRRLWCTQCKWKKACVRFV